MNVFISMWSKTGLRTSGGKMRTYGSADRWTGKMRTTMRTKSAFYPSTRIQLHAYSEWRRLISVYCVPGRWLPHPFPTRSLLHRSASRQHHLLFHCAVRAPSRWSRISTAIGCWRLMSVFAEERRLKLKHGRSRPIALSPIHLIVILITC